VATNLIKYRGRNDDGNETTATWKAAEDTPWVQTVDVNFRVRFKVQNSTTAINNLDVKIQYNRNGAGWVDVNATSSVVRSSASPNLADQANLTEQLTGGTGTFIGATSFDEVNGSCGGTSLDLTATGKMEQEYCAQVRSADVVGGDVIQLRTINDDAEAPWTTYTVIASLSVRAAVAGVGAAAGDGNATAIGKAIAKTVGAAVGAGAALAEGDDIGGPTTIEAVGASAGAGGVQAIAQAINQAVGASQGINTSAAIVQIIVLASGSSVGLGEATSLAQIIAQAVGLSEGIAIVTAVSEEPYSPDSPGSNYIAPMVVLIRRR